jgi:hypothetical protein
MIKNYIALLAVVAVLVGCGSSSKKTNSRSPRYQVPYGTYNPSPAGAYGQQPYSPNPPQVQAPVYVPPPPRDSISISDGSNAYGATSGRSGGLGADSEAEGYYGPGGRRSSSTQSASRPTSGWLYARCMACASIKSQEIGALDYEEAMHILRMYVAAIEGFREPCQVWGGSHRYGRISHSASQP